jgi:hypothetical protein
MSEHYHNLILRGKRLRSPTNLISSTMHYGGLSMLSYKKHLTPITNENWKSPEFVQQKTTAPSLESEILRLWDAKWSGRKIAEYLGIKQHKVVYVVNKHDKARNPRQPKSVSFAEAPVEAWQQAMLPELEKCADAIGGQDDMKRAVVVLGLLLLKPYDDLNVMPDFIEKVTGYGLSEIREFVERGKRSHIFDEIGKPDSNAFPLMKSQDRFENVIGTCLLAGCLCGLFTRDKEDRYTTAA